MDDSGIIELLAARDERALREIETKYGAKLKQIARNVLRNEEDVDECVSDVYLKAWNSIPGTVPDNLEGYLAAIARNTALSRIRKDNADKRIPSGAAVSIDGGALPELADTGASTEETVEARSEEERIRSGIAEFVRALPLKEQKIFVARYRYGARVGEIARRLGIPAGTVKSTLSRIRSGLAARLRKDGIDV